MGYICHELFLIVFHITKLRRHIVQGGREIAHFVFGVDGNLILQIAGRVLLGSFGNLAQRSVHKELEGKQDHERQGENNT